MEIIIAMIISLAQPSDRPLWDDFVTKQSSGSFLQSWLWGDFQAAAGFRIQRLIIRDSIGVDKHGFKDEEIFAVSLLVERQLAFGKIYWYAPWGPVTKEGLNDEQYSQVLKMFRAKFADERGGSEVFLRIEPKSLFSEERKNIISSAKYNLLSSGVQPKDTLVLNIAQSEDDILRQMHSKTRYNIRIAIRHGVTVAEETNNDGLKYFYQMAQEIEKRGDFHFHKESYYQKMLEVLGREQMVSLLVARHDNEPLAAGIFIKFGKTFTYAHGASFKKKAHVMAPHQLHWEALVKAKKENFSAYDFFGVAPNEDPKHSWSGISRFKRGFGGNEEHYFGAADTVFDVLGYQAIYAARALRNVFLAKK